MTRDTARIILLALLLLALGLRLHRLDHQELRGDEAFGYFFSLRPYAEIVDATVELQEPHPVAGYFVQKPWMGLAGHGEFAMRFVSVWFSVLAVALLYRLGRRLGLTAVVGLAASALLAINPYIIWHAQDARMYSMSLALTLASTLLAVEWLARCSEGRSGWPWALAYVAVSWLALHTHYFVVFVLAAQYLYVVGWTLWRRRWRTLAVWLLLQGAVFLLYLPWLIRAASTLAGYGGNGDSPAFLDMLQRSLAVFAAGESIGRQQATGLALLALLLLALGAWRLIRHGPETRSSALLLWLYLCVPLLATWVSSLQRPIFNERYLAAAAPPFYLLIASVLLSPMQARAGRRQPLRYTGAALLLIFVLGALVALNSHYHDPASSKTRGWRLLSEAIEDYSVGLPEEQIRIAQNFPDPTLWYYYDGPVEHVVLPPQPHDGEGAASAVSSLVQAGVQRVILPSQPAPNWDNAGIAASALSTAYAPIHEAQVGVWPVAVYESIDQGLSAADIHFENGISIVGLDIAPRILHPGGLLSVRLRWHGDVDNLAGDEKMTLQLLGPDGQVVTQVDRALTPEQISPPSATSDAYGMLLPEALDQGEHRLIVALYVPTADGSRRIPTAAGEDAATIQLIQR